MLSSSHCPHTGVVNFFARAEPLFVVGSVIKASEPGLCCAYSWPIDICRLAAAQAVRIAS